MNSPLFPWAVLVVGPCALPLGASPGLLPAFCRGRPRPAPPWTMTSPASTLDPYYHTQSSAFPPWGTAPSPVTARIRPHSRGWTVRGSPGSDARPASLEVVPLEPVTGVGGGQAPGSAPRFDIQILVSCVLVLAGDGLGGGRSEGAVPTGPAELCLRIHGARSGARCPHRAPGLSGLSALRGWPLPFRPAFTVWS